jgi:hypothetical protein
VIKPPVYCRTAAAADEFRLERASIWKLAGGPATVRQNKTECSAMIETTLLVVSGKKLTVPRLLKRTLQIAIAVMLTAAVFLVVIVGNGLLVGRQTSLQAGINLWLAFIKRPDILATMILTAFVTVLFVYWQRNQERRAGGASRMQG